MTQKKEGTLTKDLAPVQERYIVPEVDIHETREAYVLEAEMPGVAKEGLQLTLEGHVLTIVGHRANELPNGTVVYQESNGYSYRRVFELDPEIESGKINARMEQGILIVTLPKAEKVKPRKISVG